MNSGWQYPPAPVARTSGVNCLVSGLVGVLAVTDSMPRAAAALLGLALGWSVIGVVMIWKAPVLSRRLYLIMHLAGLFSIALFCTVAGDSTTALSGMLLQILLVPPAFIVLPNRIARRTTVLSIAFIVYLGVFVGDVPLALTGGSALVAVAVAITAGWVQSVASMAEIDDLTQLVNRRRLTREIESRPGTRTGEKIDSIAVVDIDHFKAINDRHGHAAGDRTLEVVSNALRQTLPPQYLLSRSGGDEFTVLCANGSAAQLSAAVDRARSELPSELTISVGVAGRQRGEAASITLARADRALYLSKQRGRNCTTVHN